MQKNLFLLLIVTSLLCACDVVGCDGNGLPAYLQEKRELINEHGVREVDSYVTAYIEQVNDRAGAIEEERKKKIEKLCNVAYDRKRKLYSNPGLARFFEWLTNLITWSYESSDLIAQYNTLDTWCNEMCAKVNSAAKEYEKYASKTPEIKYDVYKKLKRECAKNMGFFRKIGTFDEVGDPKILPAPDISCLQKNEKTIEDILFPKFLTRFHDQEIPITQEEVFYILTKDKKIAKWQGKLQSTIGSINAVVEQYENQKCAHMSSYENKNEEIESNSND